MDFGEFHGCFQRRSGFTWHCCRPQAVTRDWCAGIAAAIGHLEATGHFGPFAVVLDQQLFLVAQTPSPSLVLPQDRITPFLGGGPLLRSSTLNASWA